MSEAVVVAVIAASSGILIALFQGLKKQNSTDHQVVADGLNRIENKLDNHIDGHLKGDI